MENKSNMFSLWILTQSLFAKLRCVSLSFIQEDA